MKRFNSSDFWTVIFVIVFLLQGCSSTKISISSNNKEIGTKSLNYSDYWSAILMADPSYIDSNDVSKQELEFALALKKIVNNNFETALPDLWKIFSRRPADDSTNMKYFSFQYLFGYYQQIGRMDTCLLLQYQKNSIINADDSILSLVHYSYINENPEILTMSKDADTIPMIENSSGHPLAEVEINGKKYKFIFDTGAMVTIVDAELAKECGIKPLTSEEITVGSSNVLDLQAKKGYCDEITFGSTSIRNHLTFISEKDNMDMKFLWLFTILECDGLLGWSVLRNFDITFDYYNKQIIIRKPIKRDVKEKNMFWLLHPIVKLKTKDGIQLNSFFDSGANFTELKEIVLQKIPKADLGWNFSYSSGIAGGVFSIFDVYPEIDLYTNSKRINLKNIDIQEDSELIIIYDAIIGSGLGKSGSIRIDAMNGIFEVENEFDLE